VSATTHNRMTLAELDRQGISVWAKRCHYHGPSNGWYWAKRIGHRHYGDVRTRGPFETAEAAGADAARWLAQQPEAAAS
jgi:hypothetical protein